MKIKNKFNNQNKKILKICLLIFIFGVCIYLLYFNDKILVQRAIQNSLNANDNINKPDIIENFNVTNYVDICKNRETRFYNFSSNASNTSSSLQFVNMDATANCENICDITPNCQAFITRETSSSTIDPSKCYMYISALDSSFIDTNSSMSIKVNCNSKILPASSYTYNGMGYINKKYFEKNKSKFSYIDTYLDKANELVSNIKNTNTNIDAIIRGTDSGSEQAIANVQNNSIGVGTWMTEFGNLIGVDTTTLFTSNDSRNFFIDNIETDPKYIALKKLFKLSKETPAIEEKIADSERSVYIYSLFYTILAFIIVITIILLVLYRLNNNVIITDRFMITYFIIIVLIFTLIRFMLIK
jgi:hypothetical protein